MMFHIRHCERQFKPKGGTASHPLECVYSKRYIITSVCDKGVKLEPHTLLVEMQNNSHFGKKLVDS